MSLSISFKNTLNVPHRGGGWKDQRVNNRGGVGKINVSTIGGVGKINVSTIGGGVEKTNVSTIL